MKLEKLVDMEKTLFIELDDDVKLAQALADVRPSNPGGFDTAIPDDGSDVANHPSVRMALEQYEREQTQQWGHYSRYDMPDDSVFDALGIRIISKFYETDCSTIVLRMKTIDPTDLYINTIANYCVNETAAHLCQNYLRPQNATMDIIPMSVYGQCIDGICSVYAIITVSNEARNRFIGCIPELVDDMTGDHERHLFVSTVRDRILCFNKAPMQRHSPLTSEEYFRRLGTSNETIEDYLMTRLGGSSGTRVKFKKFARDVKNMTGIRLDRAGLGDEWRSFRFIPLSTIVNTMPDWPAGVYVSDDSGLFNASSVEHWTGKTVKELNMWLIQLCINTAVNMSPARLVTGPATITDDGKLNISIMPDAANRNTSSREMLADG